MQICEQSYVPWSPRLSWLAASGQFISFLYERLIKEETVVLSGDGGGGGSVPLLSQSRDRNAHKYSAMMVQPGEP